MQTLKRWISLISVVHMLTTTVFSVLTVVRILFKMN